MPCSMRNSAVWNPSGSFWRMVCSITVGPAKPTRAPRLGHENVAEHGERCGDAAVGGVGEHADAQHAFFVQAGERLRSLRHLHQRDAALLHARAARCRDDDQRVAGFECELGGAGDDLTDGCPHAPAHEREVHDGDDDRHLADRGPSVDGGVAPTGLAPGLLEAGRVRLGVGEGEDVNALDIAAQVLERVGVEQLRQPLVSGQAEVVVALGAHLEVAHESLGVDEGVARRALDPRRRLRRLRCRRHQRLTRGLGPRRVAAGGRRARSPARRRFRRPWAPAGRRCRRTAGWRCRPTGRW